MIKRVYAALKIAIRIVETKEVKGSTPEIVKLEDILCRERLLTEVRRVIGYFAKEKKLLAARVLWLLLSILRRSVSVSSAPWNKYPP